MTTTVTESGSAGADGTSGASPTPGLEGDFIFASYIGTLNDSLSYNVNGGAGGHGGNATSGPGLSGGDGGDGGNATGNVDGATLSDLMNGLFKVDSIVTGGAGGTAGSGNSSGFDGNGGDGGNATATIKNIAPTFQAGNSTDALLTAAAHAGSGGLGITPGSNGIATALIGSNTFDLSMLASSFFALTATADSATAGSEFSSIASNTIHGPIAGTEVQLEQVATHMALTGNSVTMAGGADNIDLFFQDGGVASASLDFHGNVFDGGGGEDVLQLEFNAFTTAFELTAPIAVDLGAHTLTVNGGSNTIQNIEDIWISGPAAASITGDGNDNVLRGGTQADTILGAGGNDNIQGRGGDDHLDGGSGDDIISGGPGTNTIFGGIGNDTIDITQGTDDTVDAGADNDIIQAGAALRATTTINGGSGNDTVTLQGSYTGGTALVFSATTMVNVETLQLAGGFSYTLTTADATVAAGQTLTVDATNLGSSDSLNFTGTAETDGAFAITGGAGSDVLAGGAGNDTLNGGGGIDTVSYAAASGAVTVSLASTSAQSIGGGQGSDTLLNIENLIGSSSGDNLTGGSGANTIQGGDGDDIIVGGGGADTLQGGNGDDRISQTGSAGSTIDGGSGNDVATLDESTLAQAVTATFTSGAAFSLPDGTTLANIEYLQLTTGAGDDSLTFVNPVRGGTGFTIDSWNGGGGNDTVTVDLSAATTIVTSDSTGVADNVNFNVRFSNIENFHITGGQADNSLTGDAGNDVLIGGPQQDVLQGQGGSNTLSGGGGNDLITDSGTGSTLDGGTGVDRLILDRSAAAGSIAFTFTEGSSTPVALADGTTFQNFEALYLTTGSGDDSVTFNQPIHTIYPPGSWNGGAGTDTATVDLSADANAVTVGLVSGTYTVADTTGSIMTFANVEKFVLDGGSANDSLTGLAGNDVLRGGGGNDALDGGAGTDTAQFSGAEASYTVSYDAGTQRYTVTDHRGGAPDGSDTVKNVEQFQFSDGTYTFDTQARITSQTVVAMDGSSTLTQYDATGTLPWTSQVTTYDATGSATSQVVNEANGTFWVTNYDPSNANDVSWTTLQYNAAHNAAETMVVTYDNLTHAVTLFDYNNLYSWADVTINFDNNWTAVSIVGDNDDGSHNITMAAIAGAYDTALWFATPFDPNYNSAPVDTVLTGGGGRDVLYGHAGNDTITGGPGNDYMAGGAGDDRFVFTPGSGFDTIADFTPGDDGNDLIDLHGFGVTTFTALQALMQQVGVDTLITLGSDHIVLHNVAPAQLNAGDFVLS